MIVTAPELAYQSLDHIRCWTVERGKHYRARWRIQGRVRYSRRKSRTAEGAEIYGLRVIQRLRESNARECQKEAV